MTWENVAPGVDRLAVPNGWIYRVTDAAGEFAVTFVPRALGVSHRAERAT